MLLSTGETHEKKNTSVVLAILSLISVYPADAQQTGKVLRIGFLDNSTAAGSAVLVDAFRQEMRKLGWKKSPSSTGLPSKRMSACLSLRRTWFVLRLI
jgi:hypothetical protein